MNDLFFDTPWWLPTIIALIGIVLFVSGNARQKAALRNSGAVVILVAVALVLLSFFVMTQKEKCQAQARQIVHAVGEGDFPKVKGLLDAQTTVNGRFVGPGQIVPAAEAAAKAYDLSSLSILSSDVQQKQTVITVSMTILAQSKSNQPTRVDCQFQWNESANGWHLQDIDITNIGGQDPNNLLRRIPSF